MVAQLLGIAAMVAAVVPVEVFILPVQRYPAPEQSPREVALGMIIVIMTAAVVAAAGWEFGQMTCPHLVIE